MQDTIGVLARLHDGTTAERELTLSWQGSEARLAHGSSTPEPDHPIQISDGPHGTIAITCRPSAPVDSVSVTFSTRLENFDSVLVPDTGRWFMNSDDPIATWRFSGHLPVRTNALRVPLFAFEGLGARENLSVGLVSEPREMDIHVVEPASNRALNVHFRRLTLRFDVAMSTDDTWVSHRAGENPTVWLVVRRDPVDGRWTKALDTFSTLEREILGVTYSAPDSAIGPYWCTWVDWSSDQVQQDTVADNVREAARLGFKNIVVDDGWFGPGLDSPYSTALNIGDWEFDRAKYPDFGKLLTIAHDHQLNLLLWCAPHAVGPASSAYGRLEPHLVADDQGDPIINPTMFFSLCFRDAAARDEMVDVVRRLCVAHEIDGLKYDLFNWLPLVECTSPRHAHDRKSSIDGLRDVLARARSVTDAHRRPMIIELKQDYGAPALVQLGSVVRAGDAPYASATNLLRMSHLQARGMPALNDYQTFSPDTSPTDVALIGLRMIAAGIPAWGRDLTRLTEEQSSTIANLHTWYAELLTAGATWRRRHDADDALTIPLADSTVVVHTTPHRPVLVTDDIAEIANATTAGRVMVRTSSPRTATEIRSIVTGTSRPIRTSVQAGVSEISLQTGEILVLAEGSVDA